ADLTMQRWHAIHSASANARPICSGEKSARVADAIIDGLKASQDEKSYICVPARPGFRPGAAVRVVEGVFASCLGQIEGMTYGEPVVILLDLLGRKVRVSMGMDAIAAASRD